MGHMLQTLHTAADEIVFLFLALRVFLALPVSVSVCVCLSVICHLHLWHSDLDLSRATVVKL